MYDIDYDMTYDIIGQCSIRPAAALGSLRCGSDKSLNNALIVVQASHWSKGDVTMKYSQISYMISYMISFQNI
jgi:hypothetical protein